MKTRWIGVATTALMVAAGPAWAADTSSARIRTTETKHAAGLTASAWAALGKGDAAGAVHDAEAVALILPNDPGTRALLGRAYLAAGRFASAETAFSDALTLNPSLPRAAVNRALAQIALGKGDAARASLAMAEGLAPDADIGLAQALLGDGEGARQRLDSAARAADADARTRQNLGLAYALEGRWVDAVAIAQQDVPADLMPQRLRRWAMIAQLKADPAMQIGAILGVLPAADSGQPAALALVHLPPVTAAPVALANAAPAPAPAVAEALPASPAVTIPVPPIVHRQNISVVTQTSFVPPPLEALAATPSPTAPIAAPALASAPAAPAEPVAPAVVARKAVAWAGPPRMRSAPARPVLLASQVGLKPVSARNLGSWAVQLGAFSSPQRTEVAWGKLTGKARFMTAYTPTGSGRRWGKAMIYRLSVSGLPTRQEAANLCLRIRASGGDCFVRSARGDRPMQWASRPRTDQPV